MGKTKHTSEPWSINHWSQGAPGVRCIKLDSTISYYQGDAVEYRNFKIVSKIDPLEHNIQGSFEGAHIAEINDFSEESKMNAIRIVECINALAGIENPEQWVEMAKTHLIASKLQANQNDRLKKALSKIASIEIGCAPSVVLMQTLIEDARAALDL